MWSRHGEWSTGFVQLDARLGRGYDRSMKKISVLLSVMILMACHAGPRIETVTETGEKGYLDGSRQTARFDRLRSLTVGPEGQIWISDYNNHKPSDREGYNNLIRKISPDGLVSTVAGGTTGYADGTGTKAQFWSMSQLIWVNKGYLVIADYQNRRLRKMTPEGEVSTIAGNGASASTDGPALQSSLNGPSTLAEAPDGSLYIGEANSRKIRKLDTSGVVTTFAGSGLTGREDGPGPQASFTEITALVCDEAGNLIVADAREHLIRKISPEGIVTTLAGTSKGYSDGPGVQAAFNKPSGLALDDKGNLYIADLGNNRIRVLDPAGVVRTVAGSGGFGDQDGPALEATFNNPESLVWDPSGSLLILDLNNNKIRRLFL